MEANGIEPVVQMLGLGLKRAGVDAVVVLIGHDWLGWRCSVDGVVD
jgi:hypothetical protein